MKRFFSPSWKTTLGGLAGVIIALTTQIGNEYDNDPTTHFSYAIVALAFSAFWTAFNSRDNKVSTEQARNG